MDRRDVLKATAALTGASLLSAANVSAATGSGGKNSAVPPFVAVADGCQLFCRDWGTGRAAVFLAGWCLPSDFWSYVMAQIADSDFRCVAFDRRGHGRSTDPGRGYDYDTLADDLAAVLNTLDLKQVTLVAHSMAGGEAVRYLTRHGATRIARLVLVGATLPFISKAPDNPDGIDPAIFEGLRGAWKKDFPRWLRENSRPFFQPDTSEALMEWGINLMLQASLHAALECNRAMTTTDFRTELQKLSLPSLVIHGDHDVSAPLAITGAKTAKLVTNAQLKVYAGAHGLPLTHAAQLAGDVRTFMS